MGCACRSTSEDTELGIAKTWVTHARIALDTERISNIHMNIMKDLTQRQREILNFLCSHFQTNGYWPSIREIQDEFSFKSTNAVMGHLRALERKQAIQRIAGQARAYRLANYATHESVSDEGSDVVTLPVYGSIAAGYPDGIEPSGEIGRIQVDATTAGVRRGGRAFALKVRGESMIDAGILDGDIVIIEPGQPRSGDIVAALIDGETTLKRFIKKDTRAPYLKAENPNYPQLHPVVEMMVQGVAKAVVRSL